MRVLVPLPWSRAQALRDAYASGAALDGPFEAVAVTAGLREWFATSDDDDLEHAAFARACDLALDVADADRRLVVALDAAAADVQVVDDPVGTVMLSRLDAAALQAVHADDEAAAPAVAAARRALLLADAETMAHGGVPAEVEDLDDVPPPWYAPEELAELLDR